MDIDAIIISDSGKESVSGSNPLKLTINNEIASIQIIKNYILNSKNNTIQSFTDNNLSWASAYKLNGIYLYNFLNKNNFKVELINNYFEEKNRFIDLLSCNPRAVIISTTFIYNKNDLKKLTDDLRQLAPDIYIIAGGTFVLLSYQLLQRKDDPSYDIKSPENDYLFLNNADPGIDIYIISSRGVRALSAVLRKILQNETIDDIPNTARFYNNNYLFTRQAPEDISNNDHSIDWNTLPEIIFKSGAAPMQASTGCPYNCAFCNFNKDRNIFFVKPIDMLIAELKEIEKRGIRYVWFADDNFRLGRNDLNSVCNQIINKNINIEWMSFIRASALKDTDIKLLKQSGCMEVQIGIESADQTILNNMNKKSNPGLYSEVIQKLLLSGINCTCYFIFGFPGETQNTINNTIEFIKKIEMPQAEGVLSWSIYPFLLTPLSPIYENNLRKKFGLSGYMDKWRHDTMDSKQAYANIKKAFIQLENSSPVYREDNIKLLNSLSLENRKRFIIERHRLSKIAIKNTIGPNDIIRSFNDIISGI